MSEEVVDSRVDAILPNDIGRLRCLLKPDWQIKNFSLRLQVQSKVRGILFLKSDESSSWPCQRVEISEQLVDLNVLRLRLVKLLKSDKTTASSEGMDKSAIVERKDKICDAHIRVQILLFSALAAFTLLAIFLHLLHLFVHCLLNLFDQVSLEGESRRVALVLLSPAFLVFSVVPLFVVATRDLKLD